MLQTLSVGEAGDLRGILRDRFVQIVNFQEGSIDFLQRISLAHSKRQRRPMQTVKCRQRFSPDFEPSSHRCFSPSGLQGLLKFTKTYIFALRWRNYPSL